MVAVQGSVGERRNRLQIAFIGLGAMGLAMTRVLQEAGHSVPGCTRTPSRLADADRARIALAATPAAAVDDADVVITMLPDGPDVIEVSSTQAAALGAA